MDVLGALITPLGVALLGYVVVAAVLALVVHPLRVHMVSVAEKMLAEGRWNAEERAKINQLLDTCMSFRVGLAMILAVVAVTAEDLLGRERAVPKARIRLVADPRFHVLLRLYFLSALAANPLATLVVVPLMIVSGVVEKLTGGSINQVVEEPSLRAAASIPPASNLRPA